MTFTPHITPYTYMYLQSATYEMKTFYQPINWSGKWMRIVNMRFGNRHYCCFVSSYITNRCCLFSTLISWKFVALMRFSFRANGYTGTPSNDYQACRVGIWPVGYSMKYEVSSSVGYERIHPSVSIRHRLQMGWVHMNPSRTKYGTLSTRQY